MGRTVLYRAVPVALFGLVAFVVVACKSDDGGEPANGGGSGGSSGAASGGASGASGAGGTPATHPPDGCFKGPTQCNPLNNAPCTFEEACDILVEDGGVELVCFPPKNVRPIGGLCTDQGPYCQSELHCIDGRCARFCCSNNDCPGGGVCTPFDLANGTLGTCPLPSDGGT